MRSTAARRAVAAILTGATLVAVPAVSTTAAQPETKAAHEQAAAGAAQPDATSPTAYDFGETLAKLEGEQLEITFLAAIIPHHRGAMEMAELELDRGVSPQIRTQAENIIASQQNQIDQFTRWLDEWYGLTPEQAMEQVPAEARDEMATMEQESQQDMADLEKVPAGKKFDVAFVQKMIPHHSAGIVEFLEPQARAPHAELRVAATNGIVSQESQVADFRTWLAGQAR
ncbi:DUF305 domain-containing protein [Georgenia yuyongxinii]